MRLGNLLYLRPTTLSEAVHTLAAHGGQILSGGTDFFPALGERPVSGTVVDISGVQELRGIVLEPNYIRIGGLTTWTELIRANLPSSLKRLRLRREKSGRFKFKIGAR